MSPEKQSPDRAPFQGFDDWLSRATRATRKHITVGAQPEARVRIAAQVYERRAAALDELATTTWQARREVEEEFAIGRAGAFGALDAAVGIASAAVRMIESGRSKDWSSEPPENTTYGLIGLGIRAQTISHEIHALIRAGFPYGARARWRTLHELQVVARTLGVGNRHTYTRFVNHRWVMLDRDLRRQPTADRLTRDAHLQTQRLIRRFGPDYRGPYGWASELTNRRLGVRRPNLSHLEDLAGLGPGNARRVFRSHHAVHVDSLGLLYSVDADQLFHAGARQDGLAAVCFDTVMVLGDIVETLLRNLLKFTESEQIQNTRAVAEVAFADLGYQAFINAVGVRDLDPSVFEDVMKTIWPAEQ